MTTTTNPEDPPPYTATLAAGETVLEGGSYRPAPVSSHVLASSSSASPSLLRQLTNSFHNLVNQLDHPQLARIQNTWPAYPGQHEASLRPPNPSLPSSSSSPPVPPPSASRSSSAFARDFYAARTGEGIVQPAFAPPPVPPPRPVEFIPDSAGDNGRPTTYPAIGHPLLNDGKVLVFPKGYKCYKCDNIGYKEGNPSRPCNRCWTRYARPFSGPLAYSFSSNSSDGNFQRPLPPPLPPPVNQRRSIFESPGAGTSHPSGFSASPRIIHDDSRGRHTNAVVYSAGDPRIGGVLCGGCGGEGRVNLLFLDMNCEVCNGVGRVFR